MNTVAIPCLGRRATTHAAALAAILACGIPLRAFQTKEPASGSIAGRVVNAATGDAVRKVNLTLAGNHDPHDKPLAVQTDDKGAFSFQGLAPGSYRLTGEKAGFQRQQYGARLNPNAGTILAVKAGETLQDLTFKLVPNAVIAGRVLDQDGETMPNLAVAALRSSYVRGRRQYTSAGGATTNDRGEFRLANLRPGRYLVTATDMNLGIGLVAVTKGALPDRPEAAYATTYFGNTADIARAVPIDVRMGEERGGADIQMAKTATVRIRGKVVGAPDGAMLIVMLMRRAGPSAANTPGGVAVVQPTDSTFEMRSVTPGSYLMMARSATSVAEPLGAPMMVEVGEQHIENLEFQLSPGNCDLSGRVAMAGDEKAFQNLAVRLTRIDYNTEDSPEAKPAPDGKFTLKNVFPGRYQIRVSGLPDQAWVKSVKIGEQELDMDGADLNGGPGSLEIQIGRTAARIEGVIVGPGEMPLSGATAVLIPESHREVLYHRVVAEADGTFHMWSVPPGKYKLLAWEDLEAGAELDPEFVRPFEPKAQDLVLEENARLKLTLKAVQ